MLKGAIFPGSDKIVHENQVLFDLRPEERLIEPFNFD